MQILEEMSIAHLDNVQKAINDLQLQKQNCRTRDRKVTTIL